MQILYDTVSGCGYADTNALQFMNAFKMQQAIGVLNS